MAASIDSHWPLARVLLPFLELPRENAVAGDPRWRAVRGLRQHEAGPIALGSDYLTRMPGGIGVQVPLHPQGGCRCVAFGAGDVTGRFALGNLVFFCTLNGIGL